MFHTRARILYVDDDQDTRLMMISMLGHEGYGVMTASTMAEGLDLARDVRFDLYMLDERLPDGTGSEMCQRLRVFSPDVPVLYYTAYAYEQERLKTLDLCGDGYLVKPACVSDLKEAVMRMLLRKEEQQEQQAPQ